MLDDRRLPIVAIAALLLALVGATAVRAGAPAGAQIVEDEAPEEAPGLGNIIGTPDAGPEPDDAGDRGGWAQLFLAVVVFGGVGFIAWRISRGLRPSGP